MYKNLAILAIFVFFYSLASRRIEKTSVSGAIIFTLFGLVFGPVGLGVLSLNINAEDLRTLAELTLALVLFTDAANIESRTLVSFRIPQRLLLIGLPLTIVLGFGIGVLMFDQLSLLEIAILATMLAPTDAALGKAVVTDKSVPSTIREALNVESGLNDGICVPILFVFIDLATNMEAKGVTSMHVLKLVAGEIGIGIVAGGILAVAGAWLLKQFSECEWITETWRALPVPALAVACFAVAQWLGGSGFIASFVGGLVFGFLANNHKHIFLPAAESIGDTLALLTWVVFGTAVIGKVYGYISWDIVLYSILSLTLIRMLPVYLALVGLDMRTDEKLFIGWFGPRGLASVVFGVIILNQHLPGGGTMTSTVACTIVLSIIAHGLSANYLIKTLRLRKSSTEDKAGTDA